jgi:hypothetical protein
MVGLVGELDQTAVELKREKAGYYLKAEFDQSAQVFVCGTPIWTGNLL